MCDLNAIIDSLKRVQQLQPGEQEGWCDVRGL